MIYTFDVFAKQHMQRYLQLCMVILKVNLGSYMRHPWIDKCSMHTYINVASVDEAWLDRGILHDGMVSHGLGINSIIKTDRSTLILHASRTAIICTAVACLFTSRCVVYNNINQIGMMSDIRCTSPSHVLH